MNISKAERWFVYRFIEGAFFIFLALIKFLPLNLFRVVSAQVLRVVVYLLIPRKRIIKNLDAAFGEAYSAATKKGLAKGVQEHFVKNLMDCFLQFRRRKHVREAVTIQGLENLDAALAKGKGVLGLGAHIGNFVLPGARLGLEGYPFSTLFRLPPDRRIRAIVDRYLPYFYQQIIPSRPKRWAVRRVLDVLKRNEIVFILGDNLKKGKVQTTLFGQTVPSPRGPVSLALRSGAAVVPMYMVRNYQGGLYLVIEPEILMTRNGSLSKDIAHNTHQIVRHLEDLIRRYPDQWNWLTVRMRRYQAHNRSAAA